MTGARSISGFKIGDRVKPSAHALRGLRDGYLSRGAGDRERWKRWHDAEAAQRGTVTALLPDPKELAAPGIEVTWDGGAISRCLDYRVELVEEGSAS